MQAWREHLICPECGDGLSFEKEEAICNGCGAVYPAHGDAVRLRLPDTHEPALTQTADGRNMAAAYRAPKAAIGALRKVISSEYFPGKAWREARQRVLEMPGDVLILGSGVSHYEGAIHLDIDDFPGVDVVADGHRLPFRDSCLEGVICEVVLEHVPHPDRIIAECRRVLKPGGRFFFLVPFLFPYHGHPRDFHRWSKEGLLTDFADFADLECGIHGGPCSSMVNLLSEWVYVLSGRRFPKAYVPIKGLATAVLFPLKWLDYLVNRFPEAHRLASTLYITGSRS